MVAWPPSGRRPKGSPPHERAYALEAHRLVHVKGPEPMMTPPQLAWKPAGSLVTPPQEFPWGSVHPSSSSPTWQGVIPAPASLRRSGQLHCPLLVGGAVSLAHEKVTGEEPCGSKVKRSMSPLRLALAVPSIA